MFGQPSYYRNYPPNVSYNPYFNSYRNPSAFPRPYQQDTRSLAEERAAAERARALAAQRSRRHQYLPDEDEDSADEWEYNQLGPREKAYIDARKKRDILERMQREREEEENQRAQEERKWQEALEQRQKEEDLKKQRMLEERRRAQRIKQEQAEEEAREKAAVESERQARPQTQNAHNRWRKSKSRDGKTIPINVRRSQSPTPAPEPTPASPSSPSTPIAEKQPAEAQPKERPPTPKPEYGENHHEAASRIQQQYRIHQSFRSIHDMENQFDKLKKSFTYPTTLDFQKPGAEDSTITVSAPPLNDSESVPIDVDGHEGKLAYTSANYPLHQYSDSLDRLLVKLDGVESWGNKKVREQRRAVVKAIESETAQLDKYWKNAWGHYQAEAKKTEPVQTES